MRTFSIKDFENSIENVLRNEDRSLVQRTYSFLGEHVEITFLDPKGDPTNSPSHTQYFEVKIRDIDPLYIRSFQMPEFSHDGGINIVKVTMFITKDFDESKYNDIIVDDNIKENK
jgi:hypothetical protein